MNTRTRFAKAKQTSAHVSTQLPSTTAFGNENQQHSKVHYNKESIHVVIVHCIEYVLAAQEHRGVHFFFTLRQ
jgi:hypothetical protein